MKLFFGIMSNDYLTVKRIALSSEVGQVIYELPHPLSATSGYNRLLIEAEKQGADVAILAHQDIYYPEGWVDKFTEQVSKLPFSWVICGFYGIKDGNQVGRIWDRRMSRILETPHELPMEVDNVDGCCFAVNVCKGFLFEKLKGFDVYDVYMGLKVKEMGGTVWVVDAPPEHWATRSFAWKPDEEFMENWNWVKKRFNKEHLVSTAYRD